MTIWPLKFRHLLNEEIVFGDDAGGCFFADDAFLHRYASNQLTDHDVGFLQAGGHAYERSEDLASTSFAYRWARRQFKPGPMSYLILVPTLRCNLACNYCQVSRAAESAQGYDWSDGTLANVLAFLDQLDGDAIKIEFQGGEPFLRLDLLQAVRAYCRQRFSGTEFIVCSNLQSMDEARWEFLADADTFLSTSIDGAADIHRRNRTRSVAATEQFFSNLRRAVEVCGHSRISALPTIDPSGPPDFEDLLTTYETYGIGSIYLRPMNHHGFARKRTAFADAGDQWLRYHRAFIEHLIERNWRTGRIMEEFYLVHAMHRVLTSGKDTHVDLRNPNPIGKDYAVVDFDGRIYPTDEARMLARIGQIDLSIGHVDGGLDQGAIAQINSAACNSFDPDCIHCPYQAFCGPDPIDDIARYGTVDRPRHTTWHCRRHLGIFDYVFELLSRDDPATRFSLTKWLGLGDWPDNLMRRLS